MRQASIRSFLQAPSVVHTIDGAGRNGEVTTESNESQLDMNNTKRVSDVSIQQEPSKDKLISIATVERSHIQALKSLTTSLLPVRYSDKFFTECVSDSHAFTLARVALYNSKLVGWIRCRIEVVSEAADQICYQVYIQALGVLAPYRGLGLATRLLNTILQLCLTLEHPVDSIYAHVWEDNVEALEWYKKRDFRVLMMQDQYYRRLKPSGAWIIRRELT